MKTETATHAKLHFGQVLEEARHEPVIIRKSGRNVAVMLSMDEYERLAALEDKYWAAKAEAARQEGFAGTAAGEKLLDDLLNAED